MSFYSPGVAVLLVLLICFSRSTDLCHISTKFEDGMKEI